jgi:hypothetical protein
MNKCKIGADLHPDVIPQDGVRKSLTPSQRNDMRSYLLCSSNAPAKRQADASKQPLESPKMMAKLRYLLRSSPGNQGKGQVAGGRAKCRTAK